MAAKVAELVSNNLRPTTEDAPPPPVGGGQITIDREDIESTNFRVLGSNEKVHETPFVIAKEQDLDPLFFRYVFNHLKDRLSDKMKAMAPDPEEAIPIEAFQRTMERLFFVLRDPSLKQFDASCYDNDQNGFVGWGEFNYVFKRTRIKVQLNICERIYYTFDNPDSCRLATILSNVVLLTIAVSSLCFILSTVPECQITPSGDRDGAPVAMHEFEIVELVCLMIFCVEYLMRLLTVWNVRAEVFDQTKLLSLTTGDEIIVLPTLARRVAKFVFAPANIVDLAAILPGVIGLLPNVQLSGGGFVVLRLIRLTRVFRAFHTIRGPAIVIARTIQQSTKALYVLAFNLMLGIVIAGSLMWLAEGGDWDRDTHSYLRVTGETWNPATQQMDKDEAESPFLSIPHAFWWAIVTATTVGYGDQYPTTSMGYIIAVCMMMFSLIMTALPVGVIGGTFSSEWEKFDEEKKKEADDKKVESANIIKAVQRIDPASMSSLMLIEVWNERLVKQEAWSKAPVALTYMRPHPAEFMGLARIKDLDTLWGVKGGSAVVEKTLELELFGDSDTVKRAVHGTIKVALKWTPGKSETTWNSALPEGRLDVKLVSGDNLVNLNFTAPNKESNPYCMVFVYPNACPGELIKPAVWRTPTCENQNSPAWNDTADASTSFTFNWQSAMAEIRERASSRMSGTCTTEEVTQVEDQQPRPSDILKALREASEQLGSTRQEFNSATSQIREEVRLISSRVDQAVSVSGYPGQPGGRSRPNSAAGTRG